MFEGVKNGWDLIKGSIVVFSRHPKLLVPLLFTWIIYAPIVLYLEYFFNWEHYTLSQRLAIVFGIIFIFAFLLSFSCSVLLELIQQLESGLKPSVSKSIGDTLRHNLVKIAPIVIAWSILWFVLLVLQILLSKSKSEEKEHLTARNAAKTLAGYGQFSLSRAFFEALEKGIRMVVFLILPATAWENLGFVDSVKKGIAVFRVHLSEFVTGFVLTEVASGIVFLPPALMFIASEKMGMVFSDSAWLMAIIYIAFAWSFSIYLEQMFSAELYMWHLKWEKQVEKDRRLGKHLSNLREVKMPSLLDEVPDLLAK